MTKYEHARCVVDKLPGIRYAIYPLLETVRGIAWCARSSPATRKHWDLRTKEVMACPDNDQIPRVSGAGSIWRGYQTMHNGLKVEMRSYYGYPITRLLRLNRGVHEPQEERVFAEVLKRMLPGSVMIELGAYWAFYSMWFWRAVTHARCYMIEPDSERLKAGERNFALNQMKGYFEQAFIGAKTGKVADGTPIVTVDDLVERNSIKHVHVLHSDIQGFELDMLQGACRTIDARKLDYIFISSHSNALHRQCSDYLEDKDYKILASADLDETFSLDGILVARRRELKGLGPVEISKKAKRQQFVATV